MNNCSNTILFITNERKNTERRTLALLAAYMPYTIIATTKETIAEINPRSEDQTNINTIYPQGLNHKKFINNERKNKWVKTLAPLAIYFYATNFFYNFYNSNSKSTKSTNTFNKYRPSEY